MVAKRIIVALAVAAAASACSSKSPTSPSASVSATGTWEGTFMDTLLGANPTTWTLQHAGATISGSLSVRAPAATGQGTIAGTISGSTLTFTGAIPAGGYPPPFQSCVQTASGTLQISGTTMSGTYTVQLGPGCSPPNINSSGTLTLNKR